MVFDKLATTVTKRYKLIIALWVIALLLSVPAMMSLNDVVKYETDLSSGDNSESSRASEIITDQFQSSVAGSTIIVVLQSDNMTGTDSRDFVLGLQQDIADADLDHLNNVTSVYTYSYQIMEMAISQIGPEMRTAETQVNQSAFLLWGVPALFLQNWAGLGQSDPAAYNATSVMLSQYLASMQADGNQTAMIFGYYHAFCAAWNGTAGVPSLIDPVDRAEHCVNAVAPSFIESLPIDTSDKDIMSTVLNNFDLETFNDGRSIHAFTLGLIGQMAGTSNMTFLQEVYDLGPEYSELAIGTYAWSIVQNETLDTYPIVIPELLVRKFVSSNDNTMLVVLDFDVDTEYTDADGNRPILLAVDDVRDILSGAKEDSSYPVTSYVTGMGAVTHDLKTSSENDLKLIEPITIFVILVLMGYLFRTVIGQFLPLGAVGVSLGVSQALIFLLASTVMDVNYLVNMILFSMLMGIGTDYSIFIVTRYREERMKGATREQAVHTSVVWAGESVTTSASTVIIAFLAMATAHYPLVQTMGLILSGSIIIALLVALTLVPSVLMLIGNRIFWPTTGKRWERFTAKVMDKKRAGNHGYFHKAATFSTKHAKPIMVAALLITIPTAYIYMTAETSFDFIGAMGNSESLEGITALTDDFGAGAIDPTQIVMTSDTVIYNGTGFNYEFLDAVDNITTSIASESMVQSVNSITRPYGELVDYRALDSMSEEEREQIISGMLTYLGDDHTSVLFTAVLNQEPQSLDAVNFISTLREDLSDVKEQMPILSSSEILVGGTTASLYDTGQSTSAEFANIEILVVVGIFIVLMLVLGSLLLPAFAIVSIAMSISWAFSLTYLVFGSLLALPVLWIVPLILFVMLMGIGMDYNVFILTRIKEEIHKGKSTQEAVVAAADWTGGIITALAVIMVGAFGAMMISGNAMLQEFGFALSAAVLLDAMVVRTYIVPAAITLMGDKAWWAPGRLQRVRRQEPPKTSEQTEGGPKV